MFLHSGHVLLELVLNHLYWKEEEEREREGLQTLCTTTVSLAIQSHEGCNSGLALPSLRLLLFTD